MNGMDVTRISESELQLVLEDMQECESTTKLDELYQNAQDCLSAYYHSLLAGL